MIASLRGTLLENGPDGIVIEAGGVGYKVTVTVAAERALPALGETTFLRIHCQASQDNPLQLYGFVDAEERRLFETLLTVQGIGPKVALTMLSCLPIPDLVRAISTENLTTLTTIRGVGKKTAERLVVELRDKINQVVATERMGEGTSAQSSGMYAGALGDVHSALLALGYKPAEFETILAKLDASSPVSDLIKQALSRLRRK
jgi:Holliday junction DNA helicase RuvA